jgi:hypothetical protein
MICGRPPEGRARWTVRLMAEEAAAVTLAMAYPDAKTIHLVMDNLNIHGRKTLADVFGPEMAAEVWDRFTAHYTPPTEAGSIKPRSKRDLLAAMSGSSTNP